MREIVAISFHIVIFSILIRKKEEFIYLIPIASILYDALTFVLGGSNLVFSIMKTPMYLIFVLYSIKRNKRMANINKWAYLFFSYSFVNILFGSHFFLSFIELCNIFSMLMMFSIGFVYFDNLKKLKKMNKMMLITAMIFIANFIIMNLFKLGPTVYGGLYQGSLNRENSFIGSLFIVLTPLFVSLDRKNKLFFIITAIITSAILIFNMRRGALLIIALGLLVNYSFTFVKDLKKIVYILPFALLMAVLMTYYSDIIIDRYYSIGKGTMFNDPTEAFENESRTKELLLVFNNIFKFEDVEYSLFGKSLFNFRVTAGTYWFGLKIRPMHVTIALFLHGLGLIGFFLFIINGFIIFRLMTRNVKYRKNIHFMWATFFSLFFIVFSIDLYLKSYFNLTYSGVIFLYLGSLINIMKKYEVLSENQQIKSIITRKRAPDLHSTATSGKPVRRVNPPLRS